jgi:hypothetical protein
MNAVHPIFQGICNTIAPPSLQPTAQQKRNALFTSRFDKPAVPTRLCGTVHGGNVVMVSSVDGDPTLHAETREELSAKASEMGGAGYYCQHNAAYSFPTREAAETFAAFMNQYVDVRTVR